MKKYWFKFNVFALALVLPVSLIAQDYQDKVKEKIKDKKVNEQIVITRKGDVDTKIVVEIKGDKITINGKPVEEYKENDVTVIRRNLKDPLSYYLNTPHATIQGTNENFRMYTEDANRAILGVTTEKTDAGVRVNEITKESAAEKMGLKEGDMIVRINETKIEDPDGLSKAIRAHKPGDKVTVVYMRDKKEERATVELTKWKNSNIKIDMSDMNLGKSLPRRTSPSMPDGKNWTWSGGTPKLGLSVQDTDDGKGVKVIEVDEDSHAAKAGVKENDVISEVDGKSINSTDEMVKMIKESKDKNSIMIKLQRSGKTQNIEVRMPKKIKTADL